MLNIFCFPYAGGSSSVYDEWQSEFSNIRIIPVEYPGRGTLLLQKPKSDINSLVESVIPFIQGISSDSFGLFGHSLGALIAFEVAHYIKKNRLKNPSIFFASAFPAPQSVNTIDPISHLPNDIFREKLRQRDSISDTLKNDNKILKFITNVIRADLSVCENYKYFDREPLDFPIIALGGKNDKSITSEDLASWKLHTSCQFDHELVSGDHFFIKNNFQYVKSLIEEKANDYVVI